MPAHELIDGVPDILRIVRIDVGPYSGQALEEERTVNENRAVVHRWDASVDYSCIRAAWMPPGSASLVYAPAIASCAAGRRDVLPEAVCVKPYHVRRPVSMQSQPPPRLICSLRPIQINQRATWIEAPLRPVSVNPKMRFNIRALRYSSTIRDAREQIRPATTTTLPTTPGPGHWSADDLPRDGARDGGSPAPFWTIRSPRRQGCAAGGCGRAWRPGGRRARHCTSQGETLPLAPSGQPLAPLHGQSSLARRKLPVGFRARR